MTSSTETAIQKQLAANPVIIYMKGTPEAPECGFSALAVSLLKEIGADFSYVNILQAPFIRERLPGISGWPTFPQLFIKGELVGGSDIIQAMYDDGSLQTQLNEAAGSEEGQESSSAH